MVRLEEIVREGKEFVHYAVVRNPLGSGGVTIVGGVLAGLPIPEAVVVGSLVYGVLSGLNDYVFEKQALRDPFRSLWRRVIDGVVENPLVAGVVSSALVTSSVLGEMFHRYHVASFDALPEFQKKVVLLGAGVAGLSGDVLMRATRAVRRINWNKYGDKKKQSSQGIVGRTVDVLAEHPFAWGGLGAVSAVPSSLEYAAEQSAQIGSSPYGWEYVSQLPFMMFAAFSVTSLGAAAVGSVVHSSGREALGRGLRQAYYRARALLARDPKEKGRFREGMVRVQEARVQGALDLEGRIREMVCLGNMFVVGGRSDEALVAYKSAARLLVKKDQRIAPQRIVSAWLDIGTYHRAARDLTLREPQSDAALVNAGFQGLLNKNQHALAYWKRLSERAYDRLDYAFLYAKGLDFVGREKEGSALKLECARKALRAQGMEAFARVSKNSVSVLRSEELKQELALKKYVDREAAVQEVKYTDWASRLFAGHSTFEVPRVVGILDEGGIQFLVTEREQGQDLYDQIVEGVVTLDGLLQVGDALAYLQSRVDPKYLVEAERDDVTLTIARYRAAGYEKHEIDLLGESLEPLVQSFRQIAKGVCKDAQPENFIIGDGVCLIDWESVRPAPLVEDVARLLCHGRASGNQWDKEVKPSVFERYMDRWEAYHGVRGIDRRKYELAFWNMNIVRPLQWFPSFQKRGRRETMLDVIKNAQWAIAQVGRCFDSEYARQKGAYRMLEGFFHHLEGKVGSQL